MLGVSDWETSLPQILEMDARVLGCERVGFWRLSEPTGTLQCECNYTSSLGTLERGLRLHERDHPEYFAEVRRARIVTSDDVQHDRRLAGLQDYFRVRAITRLMDVPVWARGHLIGVICHEQAEDGRAWTRADEDFALAVGLMVSTALEIRACNRAERREQRSRFLTDVTGVLASTLDVREAARRAVRIALPTLGDGCVLDVLEGGSLRRVAIADVDCDAEARVREQARRFPPTLDGPHATACAMRRRESIIAPDLDAEHLATQGIETEHGELTDACSAMAVPLLAQGRVVGGLAFTARQRRLALDDLRLAEAFAQRVAAAVANAQLYARAEEAIRTRDEFIAIASHELRTPLTSLMLAAETLSRRIPGGSPEQIARAAGAIARQTRRLHELVERLFDVSRAGPGQLAVHVERIDLSKLVHEVAHDLGSVVRRSGSSLELQVEGAVCGRWDALRLRQVVGTLLDNAVKFGRGRPIAISLRRAAGRAVLTVRDHGIGIPVERQAFVFDRFAQAVSAREFGGLGLGLYVVRAIIEAHGGTIRVDSRPDEGATFTIELPGVEESA